jgi:hypothetical protein
VRLRVDVGVPDSLSESRCWNSGHLRLAEPDAELAGIRGASLYLHLLPRLVCPADVEADVLLSTTTSNFAGRGSSWLTTFPLPRHSSSRKSELAICESGRLAKQAGTDERYSFCIDPVNRVRLLLPAWKQIRPQSGSPTTIAAFSAHVVRTPRRACRGIGAIVGDASWHRGNHAALFDQRTCAERRWSLSAASYSDHMRNAATTSGTLVTGNRYTFCRLAQYELTGRKELYGTVDFNRVMGAAYVILPGRNIQMGVATGMRSLSDRIVPVQSMRSKVSFPSRLWRMPRQVCRNVGEPLA